MVESTVQDELKGVVDADRLKDPLGDRVVPASELPLPPQRLLSLERGFPNKSEIPNLDLITQYMYSQGKLCKELVLEIYKKAKQVFSKE